MQGGHMGSSFHNGNYFYKLVPHNKHDETHGYEILTDTQVPVQITHGPYNQNITSEVAKNTLKQQNHNNIIPHILPVFWKIQFTGTKTCCFTNGRKNVIVLPKKEIILDVKIGNKSNNNSYKKQKLNQCYTAKNNKNGYFVDSIPSNTKCQAYKKYQQAKINRTQDIINTTLHNATQNDYQNIVEDLTNIYEQCKEKNLIFHGASVFFIKQNDGSIRASIADLAHPQQFITEEEFQNSLFTRGLLNLKDFISQKIQEQSHNTIISSVNDDSINISNIFENNLRQFTFTHELRPSMRAHRLGLHQRDEVYRT